MNKSEATRFGVVAVFSTLLMMGFALPVTASAADGQRHGMHGKGGHGMGHEGMGHHGGKHMLGPNWKETLSDDQRAKLDRLHLDYARQKLLLKAKAREIKVGLALLVTSDTPDTAAIGKQLDALMGLKRQMKMKKLEYTIAQRKVLAPEQRVSFDMQTMRKAMHKRK